MKTKLLPYLSLSLSLILAVGCSSIAPGNSKLVVRAEQARAAATETFDTYVQYEYSNRPALWKTSPQFKNFADLIRAYGKPAIEQLTEAIDGYKVVRSSANADKLTAKVDYVVDLTTKTVTTLEAGKSALATKK